MIYAFFISLSSSPVSVITLGIVSDGASVLGVGKEKVMWEETSRCAGKVGTVGTWWALRPQGRGSSPRRSASARCAFSPGRMVEDKV